MPLTTAAADANGPSLEPCSLVAALVVVNTVNGHDVSLNGSGRIGRHPPKECIILIPMTTSINDPLQTSTNTTYTTASCRYFVMKGQFGCPTPLFMYKN